MYNGKNCHQLQDVPHDREGVCHVAHLATAAFHPPEGVVAPAKPPGAGNNIASLGRAVIGYVEENIIAIGLGRGAHNDTISKFDKAGPKLLLVIDPHFATIESVTVGA